MYQNGRPAEPGNIIQHALNARKTKPTTRRYYTRKQTCGDEIMAETRIRTMGG